MLAPKKRASVHLCVTPPGFCAFGVTVLLVCYRLKDVSADTELRRVYELNRDYLPERFQQLGIHGHMDFFAGENSRALYVPSDVTNEACLNHSRLYLDGIKNYEVWALKMLDASGKVPSGLLNGHYMDLGNYEECLSTFEEAPYDVSYCVVVMRNLTKTPKSPIDWDSDERKHTAGTAPFLRPYLRIGICLPAKCDLTDLTRHYSNVTSKYNMAVLFDNHSCTSSNDQNKLEKLDWFAIFVVGIIGTICFVATLNDVLRIYFNFRTKGTSIEILRCFSFYENGKSILKTTSPDKPLAALHGLKVLSTFWIVLAHHSFLFHLYPVVNNIRLSTISWTVLSDPLILSELSVDTFLLMNGLLLVYTTVKLRPSNKKFNVPLFYLNRISRILPAYYIHLLLILTLVRFLNDGPLWKHYMYTAKETCEQSWWTHVIFLNNYLLPNKQCSGPDWYLAVDMQLAVFSPLLLIPILKGKKIVPLLIVPLLIVITNIISISNTYFNNYPGTYLNDRLALREEIFATDYIPTHARMSPWLLGIIVGYFISKEIKLSKMQAITGWILSTLPFACIFAISRYINSEGVPHNLILASIHNGLNNTAWAILMAWIIVACETGYAGPIKSFLTWRAFQPVSKLSYSIYLIGLGVQYGLMSIRQSSYSMLLVQTYKDFGGELFITLMEAPLWCLLFEAPFMKLNQLLMKGGRADQKLEMMKQNCEEMEDNKLNSTVVSTA